MVSPLLHADTLLRPALHGKLFACHSPEGFVMLEAHDAQDAREQASDLLKVRVFEITACEVKNDDYA